MKAEKMYHWMKVTPCSAKGGKAYALRDEPEDAVDRVANHSHVPRERIIKVAQALDVNPDEIGTFGPHFFPYNYYEYRFQRFEEEDGKPPTRSEVKQMVEGYIA